MGNVAFRKRRGESYVITGYVIGLSRVLCATMVEITNACMLKLIEMEV
jgi:hypothetical protein